MLNISSSKYPNIISRRNNIKTLQNTLQDIFYKQFWYNTKMWDNNKNNIVFVFVKQVFLFRTLDVFLNLKFMYIINYIRTKIWGTLYYIMSCLSV